MSVDVKFCGLMRAADAALGARLGARYLGVVLTHSPRQVSVEQAREAFAAAAVGREQPRRVGVFGAEPPEEVARLAAAIGLDVVQLHADPTVEHLREIRRCFSGEIWAARRISGTTIPADLEDLARASDRLLFDTRPKRGNPLGGSGEPFDWAALAANLNRLTRRPDFVLAGGLRPANVAHAVAVLEPGIVDVSSGVETQPGIKDPQLMRAFMDALAAGAS